MPPKNITAFIKLRTKIDNIKYKLTPSLLDSNPAQFKKYLDEYKPLTEELEKIHDKKTESQRIAVSNRWTFYKISKKLIEHPSNDDSKKTPTSRQDDGGLALKCNYNDKGYADICSPAIQQFNKDNFDTVCRKAACGSGVCYEMGLLKDYMFGAGMSFDPLSGMRTPRHFTEASTNWIAVLTTYPAIKLNGKLKADDERRIFGLMWIKDVNNIQNEETKLYFDEELSVRIPFEYKINLSDHYNGGWRQLLHRYLSKKCITEILKATRNTFNNNSDPQLSKLDNIIKNYKKIWF